MKSLSITPAADAGWCRWWCGGPSSGNEARSTWNPRFWGGWITRAELKKNTVSRAYIQNAEVWKVHAVHHGNVYGNAFLNVDPYIGKKQVCWSMHALGPDRCVPQDTYRWRHLPGFGVAWQQITNQCIHCGFKGVGHIDLNVGWKLRDLSAEES